MACKLKGNTQIEFVMAIAVICVLALIAIPRLSHMPVYARMVKLKTLRASVMTAANLAHAAVLVRDNKADAAVCSGGEQIANNRAGKTGTLCVEGGMVNLAYGYPAVTKFGKAGILSAAGLTKVFNPTEEQLLANGYAYFKAGNIAVFELTGGSDAIHCAFTYAEASASTAPFVSAVIETGC